MARTKVFVSYSRQDKPWLDKLRVHFAPLVRAGLDVWDDTRIAAGAQWREEIAKALAEARVGVLLVSPDFLAAPFITEQEVPVLIEAAVADGARLLCVYVRSSLAHMTEYAYRDAQTGEPRTRRLTDFQGLNEPGAPLSSLDGNGVDAALARIAEDIFAAAQGRDMPSALSATGDPRLYLVRLRDHTRWIRVSGIGAKVAERVELERVYTRLRVAGPASEEARHFVGQQRAARAHGAVAALERGQELRDLLRGHPNLVLVGHPGAGKTTFLNFVALHLARARLDDERDVCLDRLGLTGEPLFPVLVSLGVFGQFLNAHPDAGVPSHAPAHFERYLDHLCRGFDDGVPAALLRARVRAGGCLLLLDGLDEVSSDELRERVVRIIEEVVRVGTARGNRHVVTCRTRAYQGRAQLGGFTRATLMEFGPEEVRAFAAQWSRAIHRVAPGDQGSAEARRAAAHCDTLVRAIDAHPHVRPLTANPLLLTILAVVHWNERKLPEQRAELYEAAVKYLLDVRQMHSRYGSTLRKDCLKTIALRLFEDDGGVRKTLGRREAAEVVAPLLGVEPARAVEFVEDEELHSGILVSRLEGEVEFWHLTFGEYLAAAALAWEPDWWERIRAHLFDERWNEVVLLLAGCLRSGGLRPASALIQKILDLDASLPDLARQVGLVARILRDILPAGGDPTAGTGYAEARERVLAIFEKGSEVPEHLRIEVGEALGQSGDPRIHDDDHANRVFIRGGSFLMGADHIGAGGHRVTVSDFWIDRYPVTVAQYRRFVEAREEGYWAARFWRPEGWCVRDANKWMGPRKWSEQLRHLNRPVTWVSWYEADAYCAWLSATTQRRVSLPTEAQWEYVACGVEGRGFPWGHANPTDRHANFAPNGKPNVGHPTPVGIYPLGATPEGVQDLAGNVWEWCLDWYGSYGAAEPTDPTGPCSGRHRLLRGGAFDFRARFCRAAYRYDGGPAHDFGYVGFRCVVSGSGGQLD